MDRLILTHPEDIVGASVEDAKEVTELGAFVIEFGARAPGTAAHLLSLIKAQTYDGLTFHRVVPGFVVQGGDPLSVGEVPLGGARPNNEGDGGVAFV